LGFEARRQAILKGRLSAFQIVHLSVHGQLVFDRPELSSLMFSLVDQKGRPLDGRLFMHEIDDLNLPCELGVLSACNSARGRMIRGEGLVGLTRAVFLAGANRALVSLWFVHDEATAELMVRFYRALLHLGQPPAQALQTAQLGMLASERWWAPYYWAGFVLQGDWRWHLDRPLVP
jgi:CHAT domain-containing protein